MTDQNLPDITQSEKKAHSTEFIVPSLEGKYDSYFDKITELQAGDIITKTNCKFCVHPLRAEAESKWEHTKGAHGKGSCTMVLRFLNDKSDDYGVKFTFANVSVHLNSHYEQSMKRVWMRSYAKHLADIMNYRLNKDEQFEALIQANQLKFYETASDPNIDPVKQADMMSKLTKTILDISLIQAKLRGEASTVEIHDKFQQIIINFIGSEDDLVRKQKLMEQLDQLKQISN